MMHFYMFNPADFNNSTRHLTLPERAIYRDLIDMYYNNEQAIDTSNMDSLARRLLCDTAEYRTALKYILDEYFVKRGKRHHHHRIDKEIKNYKYKNGHTDVTQGVTTSHTHVTSDVTLSHNDVTQGHANDDVTMTAAERKRKSRQDKRNMIDDLTNIGVSVDSGIKLSDLRELHANHIDAVTANMNGDVTKGVTTGHNDVTQCHTKNAAITTNQELLTNNHKPVREDAHTHEAPEVVDNFETVDNSTDDNQPSANQPATKADQIRDQRADDIENWEAPTIDEMRGQLFKAGKMMQLTDDQYSLHVADFKAYHAEQALKGKALSTESNRKAKLRKWLIDEVDKQSANQARQDKAKGTFNIDNEDWSGTTASQPSRDSDMPDVYHPSHSVPAAGKIDHSKGCVFNGLFKEPLPNMTIAETYDYVKQNRMPGKTSDETYDALLVNLQEAA